MSPGPEAVTHPEGSPKLTVLPIEADRVGEAMEKARGKGTPAGQTEFEWVLKKENRAQVAAMLKGADYYYFPAANHKNPKKAPCVYRDDDGSFKRDSNFRTNVWNDYDRVVMLG